MFDSFSLTSSHIHSYFVFLLPVDLSVVMQGNALPTHTVLGAAQKTASKPEGVRVPAIILGSKMVDWTTNDNMSKYPD